MAIFTIPAFQQVTPCSFVGRRRRFGRTCFLQKL